MLSGMVAMILLRNLNRDIARYNKPEVDVSRANVIFFDSFSPFKSDRGIVNADRRGGVRMEVGARRRFPHPQEGHAALGVRRQRGSDILHGSHYSL